MHSFFIYFFVGSPAVYLGGHRAQNLLESFSKMTEESEGFEEESIQFSFRGGCSVYKNEC